jgi:hypothetical protein
MEIGVRDPVELRSISRNDATISISRANVLAAARQLFDIWRRCALFRETQ